MSSIDLGHLAGSALPRVAVAIALACMAVGAVPAASSALTLPPGFEQTTVISGLNEPTDVEVAPGGRVFVAEKSGFIRTYDSLSDPTAHTFADLRTKVHNFSSRGLLALAVDPDYPAEPYIYVHYVLDAPIGGTPPTWGTRRQQRIDPCFSEGDCLASVRVSKLRVEGEDVSGPEQVLVNDWCQQFQFHPGGGMDFGADGNLYVSGGDGARWGIWDYGQLGNPPNPCGDPPGNTPGSVLTPPTAEGGRLRAQDLRTGGDPLGLLGLADPDRSRHRRGRARQPDVLQRRGQRPPHARARLPQPGRGRGAAGHQRRLGGGPRRRLLRGARPRPRPDRPRAQLRLALLRGRHGREREPVPPHPPAQRRPGPEHLREPLCGGDGHVGALLGLRPRAAGRARRGLCAQPGHRRARRQPDLGHRLLPRRGIVPGRLPASAVLRRQAAQLHLRDAARARRGPGPWAGGSVRPAGGRAVRDRDRAGRRHAVHRLGRGCGAPGVVPERSRQPGADRRRAGRRDLRERPSDGGLRRLRVERPGCLET